MNINFDPNTFFDELDDYYLKELIQCKTIIPLCVLLTLEFQLFKENKNTN